MSSEIFATWRGVTFWNRAASVCSSIVRMVPTNRMPASGAMVPYYAFRRGAGLLALADHFDAALGPSGQDHRLVADDGEGVLGTCGAHALVTGMVQLSAGVAQRAGEHDDHLLAAMTMQREALARLDADEPAIGRRARRPAVEVHEPDERDRARPRVRNRRPPRRRALD